jgi:formylglycine-generating enzyme
VKTRFEIAIVRVCFTGLSSTTGATWAVTSEDEWYKAAYYKGGGNAGYWDYPTISNNAPGRNMDDALGNNANYDTGSGAFPIDSDTYYTTVAGQFQNSPSPHGTFDQGGNVWEWNETIFVWPDEPSLPDAYRGMRGGSYGDDLNLAVGLLASSRYFSLDGPAGDVDSFGALGFRVTEVPEPATLCLLAFGGLAMLRRRSRAGVVGLPISLPETSAQPHLK